MPEARQAEGPAASISKRTFSQFSPPSTSTTQSTLDIERLGSFARGMVARD
jgi:hypothetical protein